MRAEKLWLETDEDGWHLLIEDDLGDRHDYNIDGATWQVVRVAAELTEWHMEGEDARRTTVTVTREDFEVLPEHKRLAVESDIEKGYVKLVDER